MQRQGLDEIEVKAHQPVELRAMGQGWESPTQVAFGVAIEVSLAGEACPLSEEGQGDHLAGAQRCLGAWGSGTIFGCRGVAKIVHGDVKCGQEGVHHVDHESVPFLLGIGGQADSSPWASSAQVSDRQFTPSV